MSHRILILCFCVLLWISVEAIRSGNLQAKPRVMREEQGSDLSDFYALFGSDRSAKQPCKGSSCNQPPNRFPTPRDTSDFDFFFRTFSDHSKSHKQRGHN